MFDAIRSLSLPSKFDHNFDKRKAEAEKNYADFKLQRHTKPNVALDPDQLDFFFTTAFLLAKAEMESEKKKHSTLYNVSAYEDESVLFDAIEHVSIGSHGTDYRNDGFGFDRVSVGVALAEWDNEGGELRKKGLMKLAFGVAGGLAPIVPMLIMTLHPTQLTALLTTSLFVFTAAVLLSIIMVDADPKDILGITSAYAAVLVVFVGTSGARQGDLKPGVVAAIVVGALVAACLLSAPLLRKSFWRLVLFQNLQRKSRLERRRYQGEHSGSVREPPDKHHSELVEPITKCSIHEQSEAGESRGTQWTRTALPLREWMRRAYFRR